MPSLLEDLYDDNFTKFVTPQLAGWFFSLVTTVFPLLLALQVIVVYLNAGFLAALFSAVVAAVLYIFTVVVVRVGIETALVLFKIEENTRSLTQVPNNDA